MSIEAMTRIVAAINATNNGKLMVARIIRLEDREAVPELVAAGHLEYARFIEARDSVCVAGHAAKYGLPLSETRIHCYGTTWIDGPDYEALILARQEAAGYYD